ncbi:MAG: stage II sporulation protein D [Bacillota bacterium]
MRRLFWGLVLLAVAAAIAFPDAAQEYARRLADTGKPEVRTDVRLYRHQTGQLTDLSLEDYVVGVVAAEMPAGFHPEALKAQAVCARTYMLKRLMAGGVANSPHPGADVSDDPRLGQGWVSREELRERWTTWDYYRNYYKIKRAVDATEGLVLTFEEQLIDPLYHSSCGGVTENSEDVWKFRVPYLRSVICPYCTDPYPGERRVFALEDADEALGTNLAAVAVAKVPAAAEVPTGVGGGTPPTKASDAAVGLIEVLAYTSTGRPKLLSFNGREVTATTVRDRLGLRSTNFTQTIEGGRLIIETSGHGHGVGLCQYGARGLAEAGHDFRSILEHYYTGVRVEPF